jgi:hypothetical protein
MLISSSRRLYDDNPRSPDRVRAMPSSSGRFLKDLPILVCGLCFVAFPIALSQMMPLKDTGRLSIAGAALSCWIVAVLVGLSCVAHPTHSTGTPTWLTRLQLFLFLAGMLLTYVALSVFKV